MKLAIEIEPIVLVYRPRKMKPLERTVALTLMLLVLAVMAYFIQWEMLSAEHVRNALSKLRENPLPMIFVVVVLLASFLLPVKMQRTRIRVDATGMQLLCKLPLLSETVERKITWEKVSSVSYAPSTSALTLRVKSGLPWIVRAADWSRTDLPGSVSREPVEPDLVGIIRGLGLMERKSATSAIGEFDVMGDSRTRLLIVLGALAGFYAVIDGLTNPESWAFFNFEYMLPHASAALAAAVGAAAWLLRPGTRPPLDRPIVVGMAVFIFVVAAPTSYVAGIRLNQLLGGPLQSHEYHRDVSCMNLMPKDPTLPVIEYTELSHSYWCQVPETKVVQVLVRRGVFGLYQVNLEPHTKEIRRFRGEK